MRPVEPLRVSSYATGLWVGSAGYGSVVLLKSMDDLIVPGLRIDWNMLTDSYVSRIPSLRSIDELEFHKNVTFLAGENGSGKSTLLEGIAVACGFNAEGGTRNYPFQHIR